MAEQFKRYSQEDELRECKTEGCTRGIYARGVCHICYQKYFQKITRRPDLTWDDLVQAGLVNDVRKSKINLALERAGLN